MLQIALVRLLIAQLDHSLLEAATIQEKEQDLADGCRSVLHFSEFSSANSIELQDMLFCLGLQA